MSTDQLVMENVWASIRDIDRSDPTVHTWIAESVRLLESDAQRSADTHMVKFDLPSTWGIDLYLKDESTHPTGSLKHRLARSLFTYALVNGWLKPGTPIIEASSGSTAVSEAHFARMLGLPFIAVIPRTTSRAKVALIEAEGGRCHFVESADQMAPESERLARQLGGRFLDQFTYAERATDWKASTSIADCIFRQLRCERHPEPEWIVVSAGTGGTSACIGRYLRYHQLPTKLCVADVEGSAFFDGWCRDDCGVTTGASSKIEGIGRPRVEPSFLPGVVDRMISVPDAASVAAARVVSERLGRRVGPSTGTNVMAVMQLIRDMRRRGQRGSVVTLLCDSGERYAATYFNDAWVEAQGWDVQPWIAELSRSLSTD